MFFKVILGFRVFKFLCKFHFQCFPSKTSLEGFSREAHD